MRNKKRRVAIVGMGESKRYYPQDYPYDIWIVNCRYNCVPRWDKNFDIHHDTLETIPGYKNKTIVKENYPIKEALKFRGKHFNSSFDYMIAYAIIQQYDIIDVYGVDLIAADEIRMKQSQSARGWIGFAQGRGLTVNICEQSPMYLPEMMYSYKEYRDE